MSESSSSAVGGVAQLANREAKRNINPRQDCTSLLANHIQNRREPISPGLLLGFWGMEASLLLGPA